jgi:large subunit ribosomal protein L4
MVAETLQLPVYNRQGDEVGQYALEPSSLAQRINRQLLHDVIVMYEANRRVGTVRTKTRGEVAGSGRKLYRQKGTGHARMGTRRTNVRRGGGHGHAKRPKDWGYRMPKKAVRAATRMALLSKILDEQVTVLDELSFETPKTRDMSAVLKALGLEGTTCLLTTAALDRNVWKSARNIEGVRVLPAEDLNAYDILRRKRVVLTREALDLLQHGRLAAAEEEAEPQGG